MTWDKVLCSALISIILSVAIGVTYSPPVWAGAMFSVLVYLLVFIMLLVDEGNGKP